METELLLYCAVVGVSLSGIFYWAFIRPQRALRARRQLLGECGGKGAAFDRRVY